MNFWKHWLKLFYTVILSSVFVKIKNRRMIDDREINISPRDETKSSIRICYFRISRYLTCVSVEEQKFSKVWISKKGFSIREESTFNQKFLVNPRFRCKRILSLITDWNRASSKLSSWNLMSITAKPSDIEVLDTSLEIWLSYFLKVFVQSPLILDYFKNELNLASLRIQPFEKENSISLRNRVYSWINFKTKHLHYSTTGEDTNMISSIHFQEVFPTRCTRALINASLVGEKWAKDTKKKEKDGWDSTGQRLGRTTPRVHASIRRVYTYS